MSAIGFIGVGRMGAGMAATLLRAGHTVSVYDPSAPAVAALTAVGAIAAASPQEAATNSDYTLMSLPNSSIVENAIFGENGIASATDGPRVIIDLSTIDPSSARAFARRLMDLNGTGFVDAPVSGGVTAAAEGTLLIMAGGSPEHLAEVAPVLAELSSRVVTCGDVGTGQTVKLSHNMLTAINTLAAGEILTASVARGADLNVLLEVFTNGLAGSKMLGHFDKTLLTAERPHLFALDLMHKDISLFLAEFSDAVLPLAQVTKQSYNAARAQGLGPKDSTSVNEIYEGYYNLTLTKEAK